MKNEEKVAQFYRNTDGNLRFYFYNYCAETVNSEEHPVKSTRVCSFPIFL